jgi:cell wall-associated NlpC family hydrolase
MNLPKTLVSGALAVSLMGAGTAYADMEEEGYHFQDTNQIPWASPSIHKLYRAGIMKGIADEQFAPFQKVSRAEFAALIAKQLTSQGGNEELPFQDIKPQDWFYEPVRKLYQLGVIKGVDQQRFQPHRPVTREEAAVMIAHAFGISQPATASLAYQDRNEVSPWAVSSVAALHDKGIMVGSEGHFYPQQAISRAETAVLLHRVLYGEPSPDQPEKLKTPNPADVFAEKLDKAVQPLVGSPYRWGGESRAGFDCSGFTQYVYKKFGIDLPRVSRKQFHAGTKVNSTNMLPGDLLFFDVGKGYISHVGIYTGKNMMAHASSKGVKLSRLDWYFKNYRVVGIKRVYEPK